MVSASPVVVGRCKPKEGNQWEGVGSGETSSLPNKKQEVVVMGYKIVEPLRKKIGGKYFYFLYGFKTKLAAEKEAKRIRKLGHGVRITRGTGKLVGYYYIYTTSKAGFRPYS